MPKNNCCFIWISNGKQQEDLKQFFDHHVAFFQYYRSGSTHMDKHYFLRRRQEDIIDVDVCHFSTRQTILPDRWVAKDYRTMGRTVEEKQINEVLEQFKSTIKRKYESWVSKGEVVTASKIKNSIMSLDENSKQLIELCDLFIADYEKLTASRGYGQESLFRYQLTRTRLQEFLKDEYKANDIPLADINKRMLDKLYLWLITEKKLANNTTTKFIHRCSSIYRVAYDNGWVKANPFKSVKLHLDKVDRGYLTQQELARMMQKEFSTKRLELFFHPERLAINISPCHNVIEAGVSE